MSTLDQARALWRRGLSVIPVPSPQAGAVPGTAGDGKVPVISWRDYQTRLPTEHELLGWFSAEPMNIAVVTGAVSDVVVIDADSREAMLWAAKRLLYTPWQTRTASGFHLWYRHPGVRVPNRARLETSDGRIALDVRGDGGYVIAPRSLHASGATYEEAGDWGVPRHHSPRFWPGWLERPRRTPSPGPPRPRPTGDTVERARRYLARIERPEIGFGSDNAVLYAACRLVRGFGLSAPDAEALLWEWAGGRPGWTREWVARKVAHAERYGTESIGALR
jgi:hypothetical protein